jgi:hypothetical protein
MTTVHSIAKLVFWPEYDEVRLLEAHDRGVMSHVLVEIDGSRLYPVTFLAIDRLRFELEASAKRGQNFISETGMIVVGEVKLAVMQEAVEQMCREGYFDYMIPVTVERLTNAGPFQWPP